MIAVLINAAGVIIGCLIGLLFKKWINTKLSGVVMSAIGLCTIIIGVQGAIKTDNALILIISAVLGVIVGTLIDIDGKLEKLGALTEKIVPSSEKNGSVAKSFVAASLLMCVGAMSVVGSLNAGLSGDNTILYTKSLMDFISAIFMTLSLGIGVLFASVTVIVVQGGIVLLAHALAPILTDSMILSMNCVGSIMILTIGLNMLGITKIKVANFLPAIVFAPFIDLLFSLF